MSSTVWDEQVCTALVSYIKNNLTLGSVPLQVIVRKPDEDFKKEDYPIVSIYNLYSKGDDFRRFFGSVPVQVNKEQGTVTMEEACLPYNLFYQIDFWAMQMSQIASLTSQWISLTAGGKDFNLPVVDTGGTSRSCYCLRKDDFKKSDLIDEDNRIFHSFMTYRVYVEIDENVHKDVSLVQTATVNTGNLQTIKNK